MSMAQLEKKQHLWPFISDGDDDQKSQHLCHLALLQTAIKYHHRILYICFILFL